MAINFTSNELDVDLTAHKDYLAGHAAIEQVRTGGIGGVQTKDCYKLKNERLAFGGSELIVPVIDVPTTASDSSNLFSDSLIGLKTMMQLKRITFNMVAMRVTAEP